MSCSACLGSEGSYTWLEGNFDEDDDIDLSDYNALASNFDPTGYASAAGVPEPPGVFLLLVGLLTMARGFRVSCRGTDRTKLSRSGGAEAKNKRDLRATDNETTGSCC